MAHPRTFLGPVLGALAPTGLIAALLRLARARAQRVKHVPVSGADQRANGVPLTESQFRYFTRRCMLSWPSCRRLLNAMNSNLSASMQRSTGSRSSRGLTPMPSRCLGTSIKPGSGIPLTTATLPGPTQIARGHWKVFGATAKARDLAGERWCPGPDSGSWHGRRMPRAYSPSSSIGTPGRSNSCR
jgi:hypothetical protein